MVDAIVSSFLDQLISIAAEEAKEQVCHFVGVGKEMTRLTSNLEYIRAALGDAEKRKLKNEMAELWLDKLKDAAYDMEDVLDQWSYERLKFQIEGVFQKKVCSFFTFPCTCCKKVVLNCRMATKIKEINENLDCITKQKDMYNPNVHDNKGITPSKQVPSISIIDESEIIDRATEKNNLISKLVCESSGEQKSLHIISLVGTGGIGKTTVAQLVYNNDTIKKNFQIRIWLCVSDCFDAFKIARAIIESLNVPTFDSIEAKARMRYFDRSISGKTFPLSLDNHEWTEGYNKSTSKLVEFEDLMQAILKFIKGKKFLLVLDDMWEEDHSRWEPFYRCLKNGAHGSKILVTTRKETVALMMKSTDVIPIKELSDEECWLLLRQIAFSERSTEVEKLEATGQKIAGKCRGLPLAAKTIGNLLSTKKTEEFWRSVLDSETWKLEEFEKYLSSSLMLSYNNLDSMMIKRCFLYCAVFPKNCVIIKEQLIQLWMAQGYLVGKKNEDMELMGAKYFDNIASRSFFRELEEEDDGRVTICKMHDIVHDFAQLLTKNECFIIEVNGSKESLINSFHEIVRHSTVMLEEGVSFPISICNVKRLRSLFIHGERADYSSVREVLPKLCSELKCLRALDMNGVSGCRNLIKEIPVQIGKLIHLAYLNLSGQAIEKLPETLCRLYNLQTLNISRCQFLKELPQGIAMLINLRHLLNFETRSLSYLPIGIERLTVLRTLTTFVVGGGVQGSKACKLKSLENLNLFGSCQIRGLGNVSVVGESDRLELQKMKKLVDVYLEFNRDKEEERMDKKDEAILETFQPPQGLKRLKIGHYRGNTFPPSWPMSLTSVRDLSLIDCLNCEQLPPLGKLASLEKLVIQNLNSVRRVGDEFLGIDSDDGTSAIAFKNLKSLVISQMVNLEDWDYIITRKGKRLVTIMPFLSFLEIHSCPRLKALPDQLLQTQRLNIGNSPILENSFRKRREEKTISERQEQRTSQSIS